MHLLEKLNLTANMNCTLPLHERLTILKGENAKVKQITAAFGCASHEIVEEILAAIEKRRAGLASNS